MELEVNKESFPENKIVEISKNPKVLVYFDGKQYYAFNGICPHAKWPLELGKISNTTLTCGGHGWEFSIQDGKCLTNPGRDLKTYKIVSRDLSIVVKD